VAYFAFQQKEKTKFERKRREAMRMEAEAKKAAEEAQRRQRAKVKTRGNTPMSKEEYEESNRKIREVFCQQTGRVRLVRGEGEIIEKAVSKQEQTRIQRLATRWDGMMMYGALENKL
jgi:sRNA-binding protein